MTYTYGLREAEVNKPVNNSPFWITMTGAAAATNAATRAEVDLDVSVSLQTGGHDDAADKAMAKYN